MHADAGEEIVDIARHVGSTSPGLLIVNSCSPVCLFNILLILGSTGMSVSRKKTPTKRLSLPGLT